MTLTFDQFQEKFDIIVANNNQFPDRIEEANRTLSQLKKENHQSFLLYSAQITTSPTATNEQIAKGISFISDALKITRFHSLNTIINLWKNIPPNQQSQLKQILFQNISSLNEELRDTSISILSTIIRKNTFPKEWPDFFENLTSLLHESQNSKLGILKLLGEAVNIKFILPRYISERDSALQFLFELASQTLREDSEEIQKEAAAYVLYKIFVSFVRKIRNSPEIIETTFELISHNFLIDNVRLHKLIYDLFFVMAFNLNDKLSITQIEQMQNSIKQDISSRNDDIKKIALSFLRKASKSEKLNPIIAICPQMLTEIIINLLPNIENSFAYEDDESLSHFAYHALKGFSIYSEEKDFVFSAVKSYFNEKKSSTDIKVRCSSIIALKSVVNIPTIGEFIRSINQDLLQFSIDESLIVRQYFYSFILKYVKNNYFYEDNEENSRFILNFAKELLNRDIQSAFFGCQIISNFIKSNSNISVKDEEIISVLNSFLTQFLRPNITELNFDKYLEKAVKYVSKNFGMKHDILAQFCSECFNKIQEFSNSNSYEKLALAALMLSQTLFNIRGFYNYNSEKVEFIDETFNLLYSLLPKMNEVKSIIISIGNLIISIPNLLKNTNIDQLVTYLIDALRSNNEDLIYESVITIGDIFRTLYKNVEGYELEAVNQIIEIIQNDSFKDKTICFSLESLADIVKNSRDKTRPFREKMMTIIENFNNFIYDVYDTKEVDQISTLLEGTIYLSGAIFYAFSDDRDFISDNRNLDILFGFRNLIDPNHVNSTKIKYSLILALDLFLQNREAARVINVHLNHICIKTQLKLIAGEKSELSGKALSLSRALLYV